jgi:hypothetical protein
MFCLDLKGSDQSVLGVDDPMIRFGFHFQTDYELHKDLLGPVIAHPGDDFENADRWRCTERTMKATLLHYLNRCRLSALNGQM